MVGLHTGLALYMLSFVAKHVSFVHGLACGSAHRFGFVHVELCIRLAQYSLVSVERSEHLNLPDGLYTHTLTC